jgi:uncharacterized protein DUF4386
MSSLPRRPLVSSSRTAGSVAIAVGAGGFAYSTSFVLYLHSGSTGAAKVAALLLSGGGVLFLVVLVALYERLRPTDPFVALLAFVFGAAGAAGSAIHGAYDLANFLHAPGVATNDLPNEVDPRGLMTFAFTGVALLLVSWLIARGDGLPRRLGSLGLLGGALLVAVYVGRLTILNPKNPALLTLAVVSGFIVDPLWFVWLGLSLRRDRAT